MREHEREFSLERMAELLGVTRQGFHAHRNRDCRSRSAFLEVMVRASWSESGKRYGAPSIHRDLRNRGIRCSRKTVEKIMRGAVIQGKTRRKRRPRTTDSNHDLPIAPNLLNRVFRALRKNSAWVSDITYIRTQRGWVYLCVVVDLFSRRIVGWNLADHMRADLVIEAFRNATQLRTPESGLVFHSDRGSQYASLAFREELAACGAVQSMSRKGDCWDNAVAESLFGTIKTELPKEVFEDIEEAQKELFRYIELFYNRKRLHSYLGYRSPAKFEEENAA